MPGGGLLPLSFLLVTLIQLTTSGKQKTPSRHKISIFHEPQRNIQNCQPGYAWMTTKAQGLSNRIKGFHIQHLGDTTLRNNWKVKSQPGSRKGANCSLDQQEHRL